MQLGRSWLLFLTLLFASSIEPDQGFAQARQDTGLQMRTGVGWALVLPDAFAGVAAFHLFGRSDWGIFADAKLTPRSHRDDENFQPGQTVASIEATYPEFRRERVGDRDEWLLFNMGIVRGISPTFGLVLGGGMARKLVYREYLDPTPEAVTETGLFIVENEDASGWSANGSIAALTLIGQSIAISTGFEVAPRSISLGLFWVFR